MATNFPSSADSFTNPSSSDSMATVSHAGQHTDINDAVEAIETALLDGAPLHIDDANERVGIGTTNPQVELEVAGTVKAGDLLGNVTATSVSTTNLTVDTDTLYVDSLINAVGIGTTSPAEQLHVAGGAIRIDNTGADSKLTMTTLGQQDWSIGVDQSDSGKLKFAESTDVGITTRMTIDSSGNVGIGTTSPGATLDVDGAVRADEIHSPGLVVAMHEFQDTAGARSITSATTIHSHTITTQGNSRLFFDFFTGQFIKNTASTNLFVEFYIDGTPLSIGSPTVAGEQMETNHIGFGQNTAREFLATIAASTLTLSAGTHTVRVDVSAYNSATITLNYQGVYRSNRFRVYEVCV